MAHVSHLGKRKPPQGGVVKMIDLQSAGRVEFIVDSTGKVWVNVDGECKLRIGQSAVVRFDLHPLATSVQAGAQEVIQEVQDSERVNDDESLGENEV